MGIHRSTRAICRLVASESRVFSWYAGMPSDKSPLHISRLVSSEQTASASVMLRPNASRCSGSHQEATAPGLIWLDIRTPRGAKSKTSVPPQRGKTRIFRAGLVIMFPFVVSAPSPATIIADPQLNSKHLIVVDTFYFAAGTPPVAGRSVLAYVETRAASYALAGPTLASQKFLFASHTTLKLWFFRRHINTLCRRCQFL